MDMVTHKDDTQNVAKLRSPPSYLGPPLIGKLFSYLKDPGQFFLTRRHESVWHTRILGLDVYVVNTPEGMDAVYKGEGRYTAFAMPGVKTAQKIGGESILSIVDPVRHKQIRGGLIRCFRPSTIATFTSPLQDMATRYSRRWAENGTFDATLETSKLGFEAGCSFIGIHLESMPEQRRDELRNLAHILLEGFVLVVPVDLGKFSALGRAIIAHGKLRDEMQPIVDAMQTKMNNDACTAEERESVIYQLLAARDDKGEPLGMNVVIDNMILFLDASYDTSAAMHITFVYLLCRHPDIQDRAYEHIRKILGEESDEFHGRSHLSREQLDSMTYIDQVLNECERFKPPILVTSYHKSTSDFEIDGYRIKKGAHILGDAISRTQNRKYWNDPEKFDPDRFATQTGKDQRFATFGGGRKMCPGYKYANLERKILAVTLLRDYRMSYANEHAAAKLKESYHKPLFELSGGNLHVRLERREKKAS